MSFRCKRSPPRELFSAQGIREAQLVFVPSLDGQLHVIASPAPEDTRNTHTVYSRSAAPQPQMLVRPLPLVDTLARHCCLPPLGNAAAANAGVHTHCVWTHSHTALEHAGNNRSAARQARLPLRPRCFASCNQLCSRIGCLFALKRSTCASSVAWLLKGPSHTPLLADTGTL